MKTAPFYRKLTSLADQNKLQTNQATSWNIVEHLVSKNPLIILMSLCKQRKCWLVYLVCVGSD